MLMNKLRFIEMCRENDIDMGLFREFPIQALEERFEELKRFSGYYGIQRQIVAYSEFADEAAKLEEDDYLDMVDSVLELVKKPSIVNSAETWIKIIDFCSGYEEIWQASFVCLSLDEELWPKLRKLANKVFTRNIDGVHELVTRMITEDWFKECDADTCWNTKDDFLWTIKCNGACPRKFSDDYEKLRAEAGDGISIEEPLKLVVAGIPAEEIISVGINSKATTIFRRITGFKTSKFEEGWKIHELGLNRFASSILKNVQRNSWIFNSKFCQLCSFDDLEKLPNCVYERAEYLSVCEVYDVLKTEEDIKFFCDASLDAQQLVCLGIDLAVAKRFDFLEVRITDPVVLAVNLQHRTLSEWCDRFDLPEKEVCKILSYSYPWDEESLEYYDFIIDECVKRPLFPEGVSEALQNNVYAFRSWENHEELLAAGTKKAIKLIQSGLLNKLRYVIADDANAKYGFLHRLLLYCAGEEYHYPVSKILDIDTSGFKSIGFEEAFCISMKCFPLSNANVLNFALNLLDDNYFVVNDNVFSIQKDLQGALRTVCIVGDALECKDQLPYAFLDTDYWVKGITGAVTQIIPTSKGNCKKYYW